MPRLPQVLLLIPPLTQLNTPYPSTAYLTGFLKQKGIGVRQGDLGLDLVLRLFSRSGLEEIFDKIEKGEWEISSGLRNMIHQRESYVSCIEVVIAFLQNKEQTIAYRIAMRQYLPEGPRFRQIKEEEKFFGSSGIHDQARYLSSLFLEDIGDLIQATVGPHFGFSKYAERISSTAVSFDPIEAELQKEISYTDGILEQELARYFDENIPELVGFSVPFPGNLFGALVCARWIRKNYPSIKISMGGGYANTELRDLYDPRIFEFVDFISLDDGETPLLRLISFIENNGKTSLHRTFIREDGKVVYKIDPQAHDIPQSVLPAPSYEGLRLNEYLSMFDVPNPMHRLWNDGRWNKLTMAHGCYWKKCSFCDVTLDYISRFEQSSASILVDKMEQLIAQTGERGFHFVDEAAPPLAMRDLALEILRRDLQVSWWTNIRFEKTFTPDLCKLLAASGCIAVTGGLEVASTRLLELMEKGITIEQVSRVCKGFRDSGILVHAYLMYGFPTETEQETIDSLEIVRQLFQHGLLQSAHWHRFAMTAHSPVGKNPEKYHVVRIGPEFKGFAQNDLWHTDPSGADHEKYGDGLKKALYNYMHGHGMESSLQKFFEIGIPATSHPKKLITSYLKDESNEESHMHGYRIVWHKMRMQRLTEQGDEVEVLFISSRVTFKLLLPLEIANFLNEAVDRMEVNSPEPMSLKEFVETCASRLGMSEGGLEKSGWYRKLRKEIAWVFRT